MHNFIQKQDEIFNGAGPSQARISIFQYLRTLVAAGRRLWRGQCPTIPEQINILVRRHAGDDVRIGIETGAMTPWLVHELRKDAEALAIALILELREKKARTRAARR